ncbi:MAG TPA: acyloxyacyl hydrolase, partial [Candidatus Sulfotelmatobacter sp.]|nr:acyloxyacyl hydrolase [Candidatus Sulfotelmatobacter sp.]
EILISLFVPIAAVGFYVPFSYAQDSCYEQSEVAVYHMSVSDEDRAIACGRSFGLNGNIGPLQSDLRVETDLPLPDTPKNDAKIQPVARDKQQPDFNRAIYYRNKLEFSFDAGWLPINIPFPFDILEGDPYDLYPLRYTLVPLVASLRWQEGNLWGPPILRGNWDVTFSLSATAIPRGPETHYFSYDMGLRRNFVPRNWRATPYWDVRAGLGLIDAKGPLGVYYAQGQDFTFTINMGSGLRYNFSPRYAISAGLNWMHISNANRSSPQYSNYGINVYGPMIGLDIRVRRHSRQSE